jgi:hypothetical protein
MTQKSFVLGPQRVFARLANLALAWVFKADLREASHFAPVGVIESSLAEGQSNRRLAA